MHLPSNLNEQQIWGGEQFPIQSDNIDENLDNHDQMTFVGHGQHVSCPLEPSQGNLIASSSNDLFHPVSSIPYSHSYHLPNVLYNPNPRYNAYNIMHTIKEIVVFFLPILLLLLLTMTLCLRFLHLCLMTYRLPLHLHLTISLLMGWVHHHRSLILLFLISIFSITVRNPHMTLLHIITKHFPSPLNIMPHIHLIKIIIIYLGLLLLLFLQLLPLFSLFQRLYLL